MLDANGKLVNVDVRPSRYPTRDVHPSKLQELAYSVIKELYPVDIILEEFIVPGSQMRLDFFMPNRKMIVEANGDQHYENTPFFHGGIHSGKYAGSKIRDRAKHEWAESNGFRLIEIYTSDTADDIKQKCSRRKA